MNKRTLTLKKVPAQGIPVSEVVERKCTNCRFWEPESQGYGESRSCRRRPPITNITTGKGKWPETHPDDWCGDFKRLPVAEK